MDGALGAATVAPGELVLREEWAVPAAQVGRQIDNLSDFSANE